jgi:hypothetical protein
VTHSQVKLIIQNRIEGKVYQIIGRTLREKLEKIQLIGSSSPYESNLASPTGGRRPLPFKRELMGLSLSLSIYKILILKLFFFKCENIVMCRVVHVTKMTGSSSDDWILLALQLQPLLITLRLH